MTIDTPIGPIDLGTDPFASLRDGVDSSSPLPRLCYAAAHVVMQPSYASVAHSVESPGSAEEIAAHLDWDATMAIRTRIGATGMGIAEAMDTAQRFNLGWTAAKELIERTGRLGLPGGFCAGASTDQLTRADTTTAIIDGVVEQIGVIRAAGGVAVVLPMPRLCELGLDEDGFCEVYDAIARHAGDGPLVVHWLGPMFLPSLEGYFPGESFLRIMRANPERYRAAKLSMLDHDLEVRLRRELLDRDQIMMTGDDFHFGALIRGEGDGLPETVRTTRFDGREVALGDFSHALLGIFDAIADPAALAMRRLAAGDAAGFDRIMTPCERLGQTIFEHPTRFYKTGLAFLAWLNGSQANPMLVNHEEFARDPEHLLRVVRDAAAAGAITDTTSAASRLTGWLEQRGTPRRPRLGDLARGAAGVRDERRRDRP